MKFLITGGAGYIGTVLTQLLLDRGHFVCCYDSLEFGIDSIQLFLRNQNYELIRGDIRDKAKLKNSLRNIDGIFHLAAIVGYPACKSNPREAQQINVLGTAIVNNVRSPQQSIIFASTNSVYGMVENKVCTEETPLNPSTIYGLTKMEAEKILLDAGNVISYRFATAFGLSPRPRFDLLVNNFCYDAVHNHRIILYEPHFQRSFIDVYDIARAFVHAVDHYNIMCDNVYNCGDNSLNLSKLDLAKLIQQKTGCELQIAEIGTDEDQRNYEISYDRLNATGYHTTITLDEGVSAVVRGFRFY